MQHALAMPNFAEPQQLIEVAIAAERNGWDGFFLWDHIVVDQEHPVPISEPWTVLAAVATATERLRIGTFVTPVGRRRPWVLARQVTTVDHLSGGRAVLGIGLGVPADTEYGALGEPTDPRIHAELLDEGTELIAAFWTGEVVNHEGRHHHVTNVCFQPAPIQRPRVPIWSAASLPARAGVRRAARWDGIAPIHQDGGSHRPLTPDEVAVVVDEIRAQRDPGAAPFDVAVWAIAPDAAQRQRYAEAGATWLIEQPDPGPAWLAHALAIASGGPPVG